MSASRERKKRVEQAAQPVAQKKVEKKKLSSGWVFGITVILVVAIIFGGLFGYRAYKMNKTVLTVGDEKVSVKMFNYYYNSVVNNMMNYSSYMGFDTETALDQQKVSESSASMLGLFGIDTALLDNATVSNGSYNVTWAELFADSAKTAAAQAYAIYNEAMANGFEVEDHMESEIEDAVAELQGYADTNGESLNALIERVFGNGCNEKNYREYLLVQMVAQHYPATLPATYSQDEVLARYNEDEDAYKVASYYLYTTTASNYVEADEEGNKADPTAAEEAKAKADADAMEKKFDLDNESVQTKVDVTSASAANSLPEEAATWLFANATDGAVKQFEKEGTYYVVKLIDRADYDTANLLQIVINADGEELAEGELPAEEKVAQLRAALEADASQANFEALMAEYESEEGTVDNATRSSVSSISSEALAWMLEGPAVGDYAFFEVNGYTVVLYYTGAGETYSVATVRNTLASEHISAIGEEAVANCGYDAEAAMLGKVAYFG